MLLTFEQRLSPSMLIERVWRSYSSVAGTFHSMAEPNIELVIARMAGRVQVILRGPVTRATVSDCPADGEWLGIRLSIGTYLPGVPSWRLLDHRSVVLPCSDDSKFWLGGEAWSLPSFDNAEAFVARLAAAGIIARDSVIDRMLEGRRLKLTLRSVQRRFLHVTGITREAFLQIERARYSAYLLQEGASILDVVDQAGYFDQSHLSRSVRRLIGPTPRGLVHGGEQLSLMYKTARHA